MLENELETMRQSYCLLQKQSNHFKIASLNIGQVKSLETGFDQKLLVRLQKFIILI